MTFGHLAAGPGRFAGLPVLWRADDPIAAGPPAECTTGTGFEALDAELPGGGWPRGQMVELLHDHPGIGELSLLAPALTVQARAGRACVWVLPGDHAGRPDPLQHALPYPPALAQADIDLSSHILVRPAVAREAWWAMEQSLRAGHLGALIGWLPPSGANADFRALRRLHLLAQRHQALVFVIRPSHCAQAPSPAVLRLLLSSDQARPDHLTIKILKRRGRPLFEPVALQVRPAQANGQAMPSLAAFNAAAVKTWRLADALNA